MTKKQRGRRKRTERARKWREWAFIIRFDSVKTTQRFTVGGGGDAVAIRARSLHGVGKKSRETKVTTTLASR